MCFIFGDFLYLFSFNIDYYKTLLYLNKDDNGSQSNWSHIPFTGKLLHFVLTLHTQDTIFHPPFPIIFAVTLYLPKAQLRVHGESCIADSLVAPTSYPSKRKEREILMSI